MKKNTTHAVNEDEITLKSLYYMVKDGFYRIETDIKSLKSDVTMLKSDVDMLKDNMNGMIKYKKMEATFQELRNRNFISKIYLHNHPNHSITTIHISNFYNSTGKVLTDLDGFLLIRSYPEDIPQPNSNALSRLPNQSFIHSLAENNVELNPLYKQHEFIIIESKHSLSKGKVDKKIAQMIEIRNLLQAPPIKGVPSYLSMIQQIRTDISQTDLSYSINLIFSSDDISHELREYIIDINKGIDESTYDRHTTRMFYTDEFIIKIIKEIMNDPTISKIYKQFFSKEQPISYIRHAFHDISLRKYRSEYVDTYLVLFSKLKNIFTEMKGRVGISQFNTVDLPQLFEKTSLNQ
jgi:hypothetical protein